MNKLRQSALLAALAIVVVLVGGYMLLVRPKADKAAELRASAEAVDLANARLQADIVRLEKLGQDLPRQQAKLAAFASRIPDNSALPSLIRTLTDAADRAGVDLESLAPGPPTPVGTTVVTPAGAVPQAAPGASEPLFTIPIALVVNGGYVQVQQFFSNLEDLTRTMQVNAFSLAPFEGDVTTGIAGGVAASIAARVFMTGPSPIAPVVVAPTSAPAPGTTTTTPSAQPTPTASPA